MQKNQAQPFIQTTQKNENASINHSQNALEQHSKNNQLQINELEYDNHINVDDQEISDQNNQNVVEQNSFEQILPISHSKRQKSFSPIKKQRSIKLQQDLSITNTKRRPSQLSQQQQIREQKRKQVGSPYPLKFSVQLIDQQKESAPQNKRDQNLQQLSKISSRQSSARRTQIFSSDKKHHDKSLTLQRNTVAEQIYNLNRHQRTNRHQIHLQLQKDNSASRHNFTHKKAKQQASFSLSQSKYKQIKKLQQISSSPQRAQKQYWQAVYPESKKLLKSLRTVFSEQKQLLRNWQSDLQATLRQNLYEVQEILLQKLYEISRESVKRWIQQQIDMLDIQWKAEYAFFSQIQQEIKGKQIQLQKVQKNLEDFYSKFQTDKQSNRTFRLLQENMFSLQINQKVNETSFKVKQIISQSEQKVSEVCNSKINKTNSLQDFLFFTSSNTLGDHIFLLLKSLLKKDPNNKTFFKQSSRKTNIGNLGLNLSKKNLSFEKHNVNDVKIGQKIQKILENSRTIQNGQNIRNLEGGTTREKTRNQGNENQKFTPISHRKIYNADRSIIKDNQKQYEEFKQVFEKRKNTFGRDNNLFQSENKESHNQKPISQKVQQNLSFDQKLSSLFKKITDQKPYEVQQTHRSSMNSNYNDYNDQIRKRKQKNRQNFFRYSIQ